MTGLFAWISLTDRTDRTYFIIVNASLIPEQLLSLPFGRDLTHYKIASIFRLHVCLRINNDSICLPA